MDDKTVNFDFNVIVEEMLKKKIHLKLKRNITYFVDGRIIRFSNLLKEMCSVPNFTYRLNLEKVDREVLVLIVEFLEIVDWSKEKALIEVKSEELNNWYETNQNLMPKVISLAKYFKINFLEEYFSYRERKFPTDGTFKTAIDHKKPHSREASKDGLSQDKEFDTSTSIRSKFFEEATLPNYDAAKMSLDLPVDMMIVKKNAVKGLNRSGFLQVINDPKLNPLVEALISDSFWFIVSFFQSKNLRDKSTLEKYNKQITDILKRISTNYFKFFINLCDESSAFKRKDPVLDVFREFMAQCIFFSLYLAFPKSRLLFNEEFKDRLVSLFAYLYSGLTTQNNFSASQWDLDLGKGNIIVDSGRTKKKEEESSSIKLPDIKDIGKLISGNFAQKGRGKESKGFPDSTILNTPLYRLYAEYNRFETLNMIKPIKFSQRKIMDIDNKHKKHNRYIKEAREILKSVQDRKKSFEEFKKTNDKKFKEKIREVKDNKERLQSEFKNINIDRYQEYANYCIFISSK